jgi:ATP-binding cassette subfamily B protein RaxB
MLWSSLRGMKRALLQLLLLSVLLQIILIALPFYLQVIVDGVIPREDAQLLKALAIGFGGLIFIKALAEALRSWAILIYGNQLSAQMVGNVFSHLIRLPVAYFEKRHIGDLVSRMNSTQPVQEALTQSVVGVVIDGLMALIMLVVMFLYSPMLAGIVLLTSAIIIGTTWLIYPHLRRNQEESIHARAIENTHVIESIRASTAIKLFGREAGREAQWSNLYTDFVNANVGYGKWLIARDTTRTLLTGLQLVIIVAIGAALVMDSVLSLGMLFAFLAFRQSFSDAVNQLVDKGVEFRLLSLHLDRISDIAYSEKEVLEVRSTPSDIQGAIEIENISFRYSDLDPWILKDFSLSIAPGEMLTLTGLSGGGKTTLLKLIMGLYAPTKGTIRIDGVPIYELGIRNWRARIGVVMQDDILLSGTIADNISFFDPEADMAKVVAAARAARVHEDIKAIPMNYLAPVGNMGSVLSGGQRQRVLLARALYHEPDVLFLDEGTANLDRDTEAHIVSTIADMNITRVVVAHRPAFLGASDRIVTIARSDQP